MEINWASSSQRQRILIQRHPPKHTTKQAQFPDACIFINMTSKGNTTIFIYIYQIIRPFSPPVFLIFSQSTSSRQFFHKVIYVGNSSCNGKHKVEYFICNIATYHSLNNLRDRLSAGVSYKKQMTTLYNLCRIVWIWVSIFCAIDTVLLKLVNSLLYIQDWSLSCFFNIIAVAFY